MEIYQLRTFCKVAELGNLTRAADRLFTSQPAVSAHIKSLEEEFGVSLFDRTAKGMKLTSSGEALKRDAEHILKSSEEIFRKAVALRDEISGTLRIGLNNAHEVLHSDRIITNLAGRFPQLGFDISYGTSGDIVASIEAGDLDVGFYEGSSGNNTVNGYRIGMVDLCIAIPASLAEQLESPDWSALAALPWLFGSPLCSYTGLMRELTEQMNLDIARRIFINDDSMSLRFVANDLAVCLAPRIKVDQFRPSGAVMAWPHFAHQMPLSVAHAKARTADPAVAAFIKEAQSVWTVGAITGG